MSHRGSIEAALRQSGPLCDDCLAMVTDITPRQTVNIVCRQMDRDGVIARTKRVCLACGGTKFTNQILGKATCVVSQQMVETKPTARLPGFPAFVRGSLDSQMVAKAIEKLTRNIRSGLTEVYNEFSLQHELGVILRRLCPNRSVQFERNVNHFGFRKAEFEKREIDIVVFDKENRSLDVAFELKFPRNGQYPEQMFSFCKDIAFAEQLVSAGFAHAFVVIFAEDPLFYSGSQEGIYGFFRGGGNLRGRISKPTGSKGGELVIRGDYRILWNDVVGSMRSTVIEAKPDN